MANDRINKISRLPTWIKVVALIAVFVFLDGGFLLVSVRGLIGPDRFQSVMEMSKSFLLAALMAALMTPVALLLSRLAEKFLSPILEAMARRLWRLKVLRGLSTRTRIFIIAITFVVTVCIAMLAAPVPSGRVFRGIAMFLGLYLFMAIVFFVGIFVDAICAAIAEVIIRRGEGEIRHMLYTALDRNQGPIITVIADSPEEARTKVREQLDRDHRRQRRWPQRCLSGEEDES